MLKQSHNNKHLYDKVRQDLFEETQQHNLYTPSITTICLLQIQAYIIQSLSNMPPIRDTKKSSLFQHVVVSLRSVIRHGLRWILLVILLILDNIARILNVEKEMAQLNSSRNQENRRAIQEHQEMEELREIHEHRIMQKHKIIHDDDDDEHYRSSTDTYRDDFDFANKSSSKTSDQCTKGNSSTNHYGGGSEPSSPNKRSSGHYMVSPMNSPTPHIFIQPSSRPVILKNNDFSPVLGPSRVSPAQTRIRSSSFNTTDKPKILRRSPGQREITVQNAILPILPKKSSHQKKLNVNSTANSIVSRSSSESSNGRPRMQKTMSLSTAQQYQHNNECKNNNTNDRIPLRQSIDSKRPYERCCPACSSHA